MYFCSLSVIHEKYTMYFVPRGSFIRNEFVDSVPRGSFIRNEFVDSVPRGSFMRND
jgi:hypothetical protein